MLHRMELRRGTSSTTTMSPPRGESVKYLLDRISYFESHLPRESDFMRDIASWNEVNEGEIAFTMY